MTSLDFYFDQTTLDRATNYSNAGNYWAMYQTLSDAVSAGGGDARLANWLKYAGEINSGQGTYAQYVRGMMYEAGREAGINIDAAMFQRVSNLLANNVMRDALKNNGLSFDNVISRDVTAAVGPAESGGLGLPIDKWAGTVGAAFPMSVGGLGMDPNSPFYQSVENFYREHGYTPGDRAGRFFDLLDDNYAGLIQVVKDPIAFDELAHTIADNALNRYGAIIKNRIETLKIVGELGSDLVHSDGFSGMWDSIRNAANKRYQSEKELYQTLYGGADDVLSGATATWNRWMQPLFDQLRDMIRDSIQHGADAVRQTLHDWWTHLGDAYHRLSEKLHTDNASLLDLLHDLFRYSRDVRDPLVLDLDGDGIETVAAGKHILFDHDGDGITHASGWIKSDDGLLVLDRNGNGRIDNGSELFGADTVLANGHTAASGFAALRDLDSNADGVFSAADSRFTDVRVWRDLNQDGQSQANELFTLSTLGIASITLTPTDTQRVNLGNGNVMDARGSYTRTDGRSGTVGNLQLGVDQFYRDYRGAHDTVTISDAARALPAISGSGAVRDLQEAASLSPALLAAVQALLSGTTQGTMRAALDQVIALWASTSTMRSSEERLKASGDVERTVYYQGFVPPEVSAQGKEAVLDLQQQQRTRLGPMIGILEKFNGSRLISDQNDHIPGAPILSWNRVVHPDGHKEDVITITLIPEQLYSGFDPLTDAYAKLKESIYIRLVLEPRLTDYLSGLRLTYNNGVMGWDASGLEAKLDQTWQHNNAQALQDVMDLYRYGRDALAPSGWNPLDALRQMVDRTAATPDGRQALADAGIPLIAGNAEGSAAADLLFGDAGANLLRGGGGDDVLSGGDGNDTLYGGDGNDTLHGDAGDDVLDGGTGSNRLEGGAGDDVLNVSYWSADNVLIGGTGDDQLYGSLFADTYLFNKGDGHDTIIEQEGTDTLVFGAGIAAADVRLLRQGQDVVLDLGNGHDSIRLKDWLTSNGTRNHSADMEQIVFADGTLWTPETLSSMGLTTLGTLGNDTLKGWQGKDILLGGDGDDVLDGGTGSNRLEGGAGDDVLNVSYWSADNVLIGGTGDDQLYGSLFADTYLFNKGDGHDTIIEQEGTDTLVFGAGIAAADVRLLRQGQDVVLDLGNGHDSIRLKDWLTSNGTRNHSADMEQIVFADGTLWTPETLSSMGLTTLGTSGNDTLKGWQGKDILLGGDGDDVLDGGTGSNRLEGGAGDDVLNVSYWSADNVLIGGTGDDQLYGSLFADTYLFNKGDGHDTIIEQEGTDTLVFGQGLSRDEARFTRSGDDLSLLFNGSEDQVTIAGWFNGSGHQVESLVFQDGTVLSAEVERLIAAMAVSSAATTLQGSVGDHKESPKLVASSIV
ncbi:calcium-binding protein [Xylella fastidiosa]|uniref:calcium-binding protein n=1 Tax=Xylella fastidiosa TaxID=2371 RepID=UPI0011212AF4|nr:calcium-binding protein [Xylella fastidiosa]TNW22969.1 hemolysin [Xylella fastidiosa subsp. pauca]